MFTDSSLSKDISCRHPRPGYIPGSNPYLSGVLLLVGCRAVSFSLPHFRTYDQSSKKHIPNGQPKLAVRRKGNLASLIVTDGGDSVIKTSPMTCRYTDLVSWCTRLGFGTFAANSLPSLEFRLRDTFFSDVSLGLDIYICIDVPPRNAHTDGSCRREPIPVCHTRTHAHTHTQIHRARTSRENEEGARCFWPHEYLARFRSIPARTTGKSCSRASGSC